MKKHHVVLGAIFLALAAGNWIYAWQDGSMAFVVFGFVWLALGILRFVRAGKSAKDER